MLISFHALTALALIVLVPYSIVLVLKLTSWFSLSSLVLPVVRTKVILSSRRGVGRFLLIESWANRQFWRLTKSDSFKMLACLKRGVVVACLGLNRGGARSWSRTPWRLVVGGGFPENQSLHLVQMRPSVNQGGPLVRISKLRLVFWVPTVGVFF